MTMTLPLQVTFRDMEPSDAIEQYVATKGGKLERFVDQIMGCRVMLEAPHRHQNKGKRYHVRIDLRVPGDELVVSRNPTNIQHENLYACIDDAFDDAQRILQDYARRRRGQVKRREATEQR
jgi:ribosomal subunit interface protein